jgi:hypothetical protein
MGDSERLLRVIHCRVGSIKDRPRSDMHSLDTRRALCYNTCDSPSVCEDVRVLAILSAGAYAAVFDQEGYPAAACAPANFLVLDRCFSSPADRVARNDKRHSATVALCDGHLATRPGVLEMEGTAAAQIMTHRRTPARL